MRALRSGLWLAVLLSPALAGGTEGLGLRATLEEDGTALRVTASCPSLPKDALLTLRVERELSTSGRRASVLLKEFRLRFTENGQGEGLFTMGAELAVPGRYRVRASFDPRGQYPKVLQAVGGATPDPAEVLLEESLASPAYLKSLLAEQSFLEEAFGTVGDFLDRMNEMEEGVVQDREKGVAAWSAWRRKALPGLERILTHGREVRDRWYPETCDAFSERFVYSGLFQMEARRFGAAQSGGPYLGTGAFSDRSRVSRKDLEPEIRRFREETFRYRVSVLNALYDDCLLEAARKPASRPRWDYRRQLWGKVLELWRKDQEVPHREALEAVAQAFESWIQAQEAFLFDPQARPALEREARLQVLQARAKEAGALMGARP